MAEFRYKAYISYSHKDEVLAAWLHRAIESYRVPHGLVGRRTSTGEIPDRIRPVFRDRADLSSATDLKDTVKEALTESENLIVLCSPDAVASHWVNEEIRQFAHAGRSDRVFCIIVGGELSSDGSSKNPSVTIINIPAIVANSHIRCFDESCENQELFCILIVPYFKIFSAICCVHYDCLIA